MRTPRGVAEIAVGGRGVGGRGVAVVCERLLRGATITEHTPTYGKCEGLLIVEIEKNGKTLSLIVAYSEFSRKGFSVDRKAFEAGVCREFARARRRGNDSHSFVLWDANIRVACDVSFIGACSAWKRKRLRSPSGTNWASRPSQLV